MKSLLAFALLASGCAATRLEQGMVVCEHPLAAEIGRDVLARGGNAADAAVATALALAVVYPQAGNLGGGGFALVCEANGAARALDFRETAPARLTAEALRDETGALRPDWLLWSPLGVGVPGTPAGLRELLANSGSGRFTLAELCEPAIELAERGFAVDRDLAEDLLDKDDRARLERSPGARATFFRGGEPLREGEVLVQRDLAATLRRYAELGPDGFYTGETAEKLVRELDDAALALPESTRRARPWISLEDLASYRVRWREPLCGSFAGREVVSMPPPSSGGIILLQTLAVLEPIARERGTFDAGFAHAFVESLRRSFAERAEVMGDPDFVSVPVAELLSPEWTRRTRESIGPRASPGIVPRLRGEGTNTTHLSVVDEFGNAVALTTTLNSTFGSGILVRGAGFLLDDELDDFALGGPAANQFGLVGGAANAIEPGKRPLSSMTPAIVRRDGRVEFVLGSPGGPRIVSAVAQVLLRVLAFDEELASAVAAPRLHQQWSPSKTTVEKRTPAEWLAALRELGHEIEVKNSSFASVQAIRVRPDGRVEGASDPRRGGAALGTRR